MKPTLVVPVALLVLQLSAQNAYWTQIPTATSPPPRVGHCLVYDSARGVVVLHGGVGLSDTWEYNGMDWALRSTSGPQLGSTAETMDAVYDSQRQRTVLVDGNYGTGLTNSWEWDGSTWQLQASGNTPPARDGFALAYDSARGRTVLFGGNSGSLPRNDTWEWDGTTWQQMSSGGPIARTKHTMCFDTIRGVVLLFGGSTPYGLVNDTWEWNGLYWREHFGIPAPSARQSHTMAYDPVRDRTVMYGGYINGNGPQDTWEWDGASWTQISPTGAPTSLWDCRMVYDQARHRMMLFGGQPSTSDSWGYAVLGNNAASFSQFGQGCAGPTGTPTLDAAAGSLPTLGGNLVLTLGNLPSSPFNIPFGVLSTNNTNWNGQPLPMDLSSLGYPGCQAWIAPQVAFALSNNGGAASWMIPIPFQPTLVGLDFYVQGAVLVPGWNPGSMVFSNAGHAQIGH
jgi:hypothetical protein